MGELANHTHTHTDTNSSLLGILIQEDVGLRGGGEGRLNMNAWTRLASATRMENEMR